MIVVDTSILVYAVGVDHPHADPSRRLMRAVSEGRIAATATVDVIQEFVHVRARRRDRRDAVALGRHFARLLRPFLPVGEVELERGLQLFDRHPELGAFDALLAAVALEQQADALVSADAGFSRVPKLNHIVPGTPQFERLLSG